MDSIEERAKEWALRNAPILYEGLAIKAYLACNEDVVKIIEELETRRRDEYHSGWDDALDAVKYLLKKQTYGTK